MITRITPFLVLAPLAAGCGSDDDGGSTATSAGTVRTSAADLAGTYERTLTPADIERTPGAGQLLRAGRPATAAYAWKRSGDTLTLKAVHDKCADRDSNLTGRWQPR